MAPTRRPKKPNVSSRQNPKHNRAATDLLVNPGNPPHRHQTCAKADSTHAYHRMVILAQSPPGCRSARSLQKKATVVLEHDPEKCAAVFPRDKSEALARSPHQLSCMSRRAAELSGRFTPLSALRNYMFLSFLFSSYRTRF